MYNIESKITFLRSFALFFDTLVIKLLQIKSRTFTFIRQEKVQ